MIPVSRTAGLLLACLVTLAAGETDPLVEAALNGRSFSAETVASPDGALVAAMTIEAGDTLALHLFDTSSRAELPLPAELRPGRVPVWSADGQRLAWACLAGRSHRLAWWDRRSGRAALVPEVDLGPLVTLAAPLWSTDGRALIVQRMAGPVQAMAMPGTFVTAPSWPEGTLAEVYAPSGAKAGSGAEGAQVLPLSTMAGWMAGMVGFMQPYTMQRFPARLSRVVPGQAGVVDLATGFEAASGNFLLPGCTADEVLFGLAAGGSVTIRRIPAGPATGREVPGLTGLAVLASASGFASSSWAPSPDGTHAALLALRQDIPAQLWVIDCRAGTAKPAAELPAELRALPGGAAWSKRIGFIGPLSFTGSRCPPPLLWSRDGRTCHAVIQGDLWSLPVAGGAAVNRTADLPGASAAHGGYWADGDGILIDRILPELGRWQALVVPEGAAKARELWSRTGPVTLVAGRGTATSVLLYHDADDTPPELHRLPKRDGAADVVATSLHQAWSGLDLGAVEIVACTVRGARADALLLRPKRSPLAVAGRLPLIVIPYPNESPTTESAGFHNRFDDLARLLAARGYAVLRPAMPLTDPAAPGFVLPDVLHEDLEAAVAAAIASGGIDAERLGLFGWSYGGYTVFCALTRSARWKAAIAGAGYADPTVAYLGASEQGMLLLGRAFKAKPWEQPERYRAASVLNSLDRITTPLLIMHGIDDRRVDIAEAEPVYRGLADLGRTVVLARYRGCPHAYGEWPTAQRRDGFIRALRWFDRFLAPGRP
jgi:dienelactone hydrolase